MLSFRVDIHFQIIKRSDVTNLVTSAEATSVSGARRSDAHAYRDDCLVVAGDGGDHRGSVSLHSSMIGRMRFATKKKPRRPSTGAVWESDARSHTRR